MIRHLRDNFVAYVALFVALGGTAYASGTIGGEDIRNGSIDSKDIENGSLLGKDVAANTIQGSDIDNNSVGSKDIHNDSVSGADIQNGSVAGTDINDNSIQGEDVNESTLAVVEIKARARGSTDLAVPTAAVAYPLGGNQWTQFGNETDEFYGDITFTASSCGPADHMHLELLSGGQKLTQGSVEAPLGTSGRMTLPLVFPPKPLFEPGSDTPRTLTVMVQELGGTCYTINQLRINVIGYR